MTAWAVVGGAVAAEASAEGAARLAETVAPAAVTAPPLAWSLRLPADGPVVYHGTLQVNGGAEGAGGAVLYPAPGLVGFLAAVATHAVIVDSVRTRQKQQEIDAADRVLEPYRPALDGYTLRELFAQAFQQTHSAGRAELIEPSQVATAPRVLHAAPAFLLTQDEQAVLLEASVLVAGPAGAAASATPAVIRVVSDPRPAPPDGAAPAGDGSPTVDADWVKRASAGLLAHAVDVALTLAAEAPPAELPFKTFRYVEGSIPRMERGQRVAERCHRLVIRTLRGALMSIPAPTVGEAACGNPAAAGS